MAKRDYANIQASSKPDKSKSGSNPVLPAVAIVVVAIICFAGGYWLGGERGTTVRVVDNAALDKVQAKFDSEVASSRLLQAKIDELQDQVEQLQNKAKQGAHTKVGELKFYRELPAQSVDPAPVAESKPAQARSMEREMPEMPQEEAHAVASTHAVAAREEPGSDAHRIQIASFKTQGDAANLQRKLMKSGVTSFVRTVDLDGKGQWFRVFAGPYADRELAQQALQDIEQKVNIKGLLVRDN
ncbi:MAG: SPOR domain-containing protein [Zetaproteobacteria bacterium CG_4_9_14_3_um_filter_53_7]|nr:MAG: SPOR domain-containing protein [Zetaproteobacteria bacterium CG_4_9_14_3_um_filter_53_7]